MSARERLLNFLSQDAEKPMTAKELLDYFSVKHQGHKEFLKLLEKLKSEGLLYENRSGQLAIPEKFNLISGRIQRTSKGFAFLLPDDPEREDVFISMEDMNGAMHDDKVFVRLLASSSGKRSAGEVIDIIERVNKTIVGNFEKNQNYGFLVPDNSRIYYDIFIPGGKINSARDGQKVVVEITRWPEKNRNPEGKVIEVLGYKDDSGVDIKAIIRQLNLPGVFSKEIEREVEKIPDTIPEEEIKERKDLRDLPMVTIDGEDAKDLDDAVSIEEMDNGNLRLGVHIADVSYYVKEDSILDIEARERGTSIYLVDRVIPMLPQKLSNGLCSLNQGEEKLAVSAFMEYKLNPLKLIDSEINTSIIKTNYRLTYNEVRKMLIDKEQDLINKYSDIFPDLQKMNNLRAKLRKDRFENGSIDFDFPEVKVKLDKEGKALEIVEIKHGIAEQLIEEFMIAANRMIAETIYWKDIPFIYRVHDEPDYERMLEFNEFTHNFGYHLKGIKNTIHPGALQEMLVKVAGKEEERLISTVLLRSMKKAIYSTKNIGHFGLAINNYTHFTSPIRRYPDLMIHRIIKELILKGYMKADRVEELEEKLPVVADYSSLRERKAMEAERDSIDLKKVEYMKDKVGKEYIGIISGIIASGFFVELKNTVEGFVHVENLKDDYYHYTQEQYAMIGERTKKIYRLGDKVKIKVTRVNLNGRKIDFTIVEEG